MKTLKQLFPILLLLLVYPIVGFSQKEKKKKGLKSLISLEIPSSIEWRSIGPFRGGRAVAVTGHPTEQMTFYLGCAGGVWKTDDGGTYWQNISDGFFKTSAVGAIAISDSDPNILYVGMGEACTAVPR